MARIQASLWDKYVRYLENDDDTEKSEQHAVRTAIIQYLYQDEPENKFTLSIFFDVLEDNFENKDDFSLPGIIHAFEALEKYALNLVFTPWRQEYRTIKLFGGYYKHKVARYVQGAEKILQLMKYKFVDRDTLVLDHGSIDQQKLTEIAFNCLIASIQCEVIQDNLCALRNAGIKCSYKEVFKLQSTFARLPSPRNSLKETVDRSSINSNGHLNGIKSRPEVKVEQLVDLSRPSDFTGKIGPEALYETVRKREKPHATPVQSGSKPATFRNANKNVSKEKPDKMSELFKPDTFEHHIQASESTVREQPKIAPEQPATRAATWGYVDRTLYNDHPYDRERDEQLQQELVRRSQQATQTELNSIDPKYCAPFFPYAMVHPMAALQIPGYPAMYAPTELLTRGIAVPPGYPFMAPTPAMDPGWGMRNFRVNDENLITQSPERGNGNYGEVGSRRSFYDNVEHERISDMSGEPTNTRHRSSNNPFPSKPHDTFESYPSPPSPFGGDHEMLIEIDGPAPQINRDSTKVSKKDKEKDKTPPTNLDKRGSSSSPRSSIDGSGNNSDPSIQWQCNYCTYFNEGQKNICTMCGRSKNKGAEATPMKTGGKVCSHCTLVNDAKAKQCAACEHRLDGCSTYV